VIGLNKVNRVVWIKDKGKIRRSAFFLFLYHTIASATLDIKDSFSYYLLGLPATSLMQESTLSWHHPSF
jgi:hypothetical protein